MAIAASAAHDIRSLVLPRLPVELPAGWRAEAGPASLWQRLSFWPLEALRLVAVVYLLPVTTWIKGYLGMGLFFLVSSTITMTKTVRDRHEQKKIVNRIHEAKTEKILKEYNVP